MGRTQSPDGVLGAYRGQMHMAPSHGLTAGPREACGFRSLWRGESGIHYCDNSSPLSRRVRYIRGARERHRREQSRRGAIGAACAKADAVGVYAIRRFLVAAGGRLETWGGRKGGMDRD